MFGNCPLLSLVESDMLDADIVVLTMWVKLGLREVLLLGDCFEEGEV